MSHAMPHAFHDLDAKRIAATAGAIAVHVFALMLLLAPMQPAAPKAAIETPGMKVVEPVRFIPPTPPPPVDQPHEIVRQHATPQPVAVPDPPPVIFEDSSAMATEVVPEMPPLPPQSFEFPPPAGPVALAMSLAPAPAYPGREARLGITGRVMLRVEVDAEGRPVSVTIEKSSGNGALDRVARETVLRKWRFVPAQRNGVNVAATGLVPIDFVLD